MSVHRQFGELEITSGIRLTGKVLGTGSDATVHEVDWNGTLCAAKELHKVFPADQSPGGARHFITNFMKEYQTWSTLRHPQIVQFLGVYLKKGSQVPMLILEKMEISLSEHLESHDQGEFPVPAKIYILRQVAQALSYLHSRSPPLVHCNLSSNNILLNDISLQAKVTDFGMMRAMDPSKASCSPSAAGKKLVFKSPKVIHKVTDDNEKLDVFGYGNVVITMVTHKWPNPGPATKRKGKKSIAVSELERRQQYLDLFTPKENELFLPIVRPCLQNDPTMRPSSIQLVTQMEQMEKSHPRRSPDSQYITQLQKDRDHLQLVLTSKEESLHLKNEELAINRTQLHERERQLQNAVGERAQKQKEIYDLQQKLGEYVEKIHQLRKSNNGYCQENQRLHLQLGVVQNQIAKLEQRFTPLIQPPHGALVFESLYSYEAEDLKDLSFKKGEHFHIMKSTKENWWLARAITTGQIGFIPKNYVAQYDEALESHDWYFGSISREEAERLLQATMSGTYLVRRSKMGEYALSVKDPEDVKHYHIQKACSDSTKFYINDHNKFPSLGDLVCAYKCNEASGIIRLRNVCPKTADTVTSSEDLAHGSDLKNLVVVDHSSFELQECIKMGQFVDMWQGLWNDSTEVAIETLKPDVMSASDLLAAAKVMKKLQHENLVQLYAISTSGKPFYIITELLNHGRLLDYLRAGKGHNLKLQQLVNIGAQIANGMTYLEAHQFIHRDLGARSVLVGMGDGTTVKIANFGLGQLLKGKEHTIQVRNETPLKWTAPETVLHNHITIKSNVWSFGILLSELITYGRIPPPRKETTDDVQKLRGNLPVNIPDPILQIMLSCWKEVPGERPTFESLKSQLDDYSMSGSNSDGQQIVTSTETYV